MMIIRDVQIRAFERSARQRFVNQVFDSIRRHWPSRFSQWEPEGTRMLIETGIERAKDHGFLTERDVKRYINLICFLGLGFDTDPSYPWAAKILADVRLSAESKLDHLETRALINRP